MSVQRYYAPPESGPWKHPEGWWMEYADHARIVAEAVAEVTDALMASKREALAELEQAHAAALAEGTRIHGAQLLDAYAKGIAASKPRTLTADDPEPSVGSVAMDRIGVPWLARIGFGGMPVWASAGDTRSASWGRMHELFGPVTLIHDGVATPQVNMGLRDRDEVENRLSSIRSLMLARPPRTTADALRALADDIQGAAIDGEATTSC